MRFILNNWYEALKQHKHDHWCQLHWYFFVFSTGVTRNFLACLSKFSVFIRNWSACFENASFLYHCSCRETSKKYTSLNWIKFFTVIKLAVRESFLLFLGLWGETNGRCQRFYDRKLPRTTSGVTSLMFLCNFSDFSRSIEGLRDFLRLRHNCDSFGV